MCCCLPVRLWFYRCQYIFQYLPKVSISTCKHIIFGAAKETENITDKTIASPRYRSPVNYLMKNTIKHKFKTINQQNKTDKITKSVWEMVKQVEYILVNRIPWTNLSFVFLFPHQKVNETNALLPWFLFMMIWEA